MSARKVTVTAWYRGDADEIFASALRGEEMIEAMRGLADYEGFTTGEVKQGDQFTVDVTFYGCIKNKGHVIYLESVDHEARIVQSREYNSMVARWDHNISIQPAGDYVRWDDNVVIDAGMRSAFVARFARFVYRRRHLFRKALTIETNIARLS